MDLRKLTDEELIAYLNEWLFTSNGADGHSTPADIMAELTRCLALAALVVGPDGKDGELVRAVMGVIQASYGRKGYALAYSRARQALAHARQVVQGGDANGGLLDHAEYYLKEIAKLNVSGMRVVQGGDASGADARIADPPGENVAEFDSQTCETSAPPTAPADLIASTSYPADTTQLPPAAPDPIDAVIEQFRRWAKPCVTDYESAQSIAFGMCANYLDQHRDELSNDKLISYLNGLMDNLRLIAKHVNDACAQAYDKGAGDFIDEPINWGDLGCTDAMYCLHLDGTDGFQVLIEQANPSCLELCAYVAEYLKAHGFDKVEVRTEW